MENQKILLVASLGILAVILIIVGYLTYSIYNKAPQNNVSQKSELLSFNIVPSEKSELGIVYDIGAKAVAEGTNLTRVDFYQRGGGTDIYTDPEGGLLGTGTKVNNTYELLLPEERWLKTICVLGFNSQNQKIGEICLDNVIPKSMALNYDPKCNENSKYFVISKDTPNVGGTNILVKYKKDYSQPIQCIYARGSANDIEFKAGEPQYFLALTDNFLILDSGTGPEPRGLTAFDLIKKQGVYNDSYAKPISTSGDTITYWSPNNQKVTPQNCPQGNEWLRQGLPPIMESHVILNLLDLTKKELGEYRCVPTQG
ncbi:MAG: hypothetical protein EXS48_03440 [Candidatus Staskawiczbacteria bacterium]|nr:hypothetical protein [Candidatus Staskawiczbacteria bacterium]